MRWKADLPKMPRLPKVPLESGDPAPGELGPPPAPSAYREKNPYESQPAEYQAPTMLVEHRGSLCCSLPRRLSSRCIA